MAGRRGAQQEAQVLKERVAVCTLILHCSLTVPHLLESFEKDTPCSHPSSSRPRSDLPIHSVVRYLNGCPARQELTRTRLNEQIDFKSARVERGILNNCLASPVPLSPSSLLPLPPPTFIHTYNSIMSTADNTNKVASSVGDKLKYVTFLPLPSSPPPLSLSRSLTPTLYTGESSEQSMAEERR